MIDGKFKSGNHVDRLSNLNDLSASSLQEFDDYEDPHAYSHKKPHFNLVRALYKVMDRSPGAYNTI